jgi:hypothetical protein
VAVSILYKYLERKWDPFLNAPISTTAQCFKACWEWVYEKMESQSTVGSICIRSNTWHHPGLYRSSV